jgi:hypothetical protein
MGLRDRLKQGLKSALGRGAAAQPAAAAPPAAHSPPRAAPPPPIRPPAPPAKAAPIKAAPVADTAPLDPEAAAQAAKVEKARTRARKGVLQHIEKEGGAVPMKDAHDYSERRYFIAHRGFSDMMEWWLERDYISYDNEIVKVTDAGRAFAAST